MTKRILLVCTFALATCLTLAYAPQAADAHYRIGKGSKPCKNVVFAGDWYAWDIRAKRMPCSRARNLAYWAAGLTQVPAPDAARPFGFRCVERFRRQGDPRGGIPHVDHLCRKDGKATIFVIS